MRTFTSVALAALLVSCNSVAGASPTVGEPAPGFTATGSDGKTYSLSDFEGKYVVLEWLNHECPFVRKHYDTSNMQGLQTEVGEKEVVWLSVISSAPGKQGHSTPEQAQAATQAKGAHPTAVLLDEDGTVGRLYDAKVTPHMFLVGPDGVLLYKGAIDDKPTFEKATVEGAKNYVRQAVGEVMADAAVSEPATQAYGCSVKY